MQTYWYLDVDSVLHALHRFNMTVDDGSGRVNPLDFLDRILAERSETEKTRVYLTQSTDNKTVVMVGEVLFLVCRWDPNRIKKAS